MVESHSKDDQGRNFTHLLFSVNSLYHTILGRFPCCWISGMGDNLYRNCPLRQVIAFCLFYDSIWVQGWIDPKNCPDAQTASQICWGLHHWRFFLQVFLACPSRAPGMCPETSKSMKFIFTSNIMTTLFPGVLCGWEGLGNPQWLYEGRWCCAHQILPREGATLTICFTKLWK